MSILLRCFALFWKPKDSFGLFCCSVAAKIIFLLVCAITITGCSVPLVSQKDDPKLPPVVSFSEFKTYVERRRAIVLDVRDERNYAEGHVPGALLLPCEPWNKFEAAYENLRPKLEADKKSPIILYCMGMSCPLSEEMRDRLVSLGFVNVAVFPAGWDLWQRMGLPQEHQKVGHEL